MTDVPQLPEVLLERARQGDAVALGELLGQYRNYLRLLARMQLGAAMRTQMDPSDLVQEALLEASRDFAQFEGAQEPELLAWLRRILVRSLLDQAKYHGAQVRDVHRQRSLEAALEASSSALGQAMLAPGSTPSAQASRRELAVLVADAVERLPADYREVILLRNLQQLKFDEIAAQMKRKPGSVRMLWVRALEKLGQEMGGVL